MFGLGDKLGQGAFADIDTATARSFLRETERLASTVLADSFVDGDVSLVSWAAALLEIVGAFSLGVAGLAVLRRRRALSPA